MKHRRKMSCGKGDGRGKKMKKKRKKSLSLFLLGSVARQQMGSQHPVVLAGTDQPTRAASPVLVHSQAGSGPLLPFGVWRALMLSEAACD